MSSGAFVEVQIKRSRRDGLGFWCLIISNKPLFINCFLTVEAGDGRIMRFVEEEVEAMRWSAVYGGPD